MLLRRARRVLQSPVVLHDRVIYVTIGNGHPLISLVVPHICVLVLALVSESVYGGVVGNTAVYTLSLFIMESPSNVEQFYIRKRTEIQ